MTENKFDKWQTKQRKELEKKFEFIDDNLLTLEEMDNGDFERWTNQHGVQTFMLNNSVEVIVAYFRNHKHEYNGN